MYTSKIKTDKGYGFSDGALKELDTLINAVRDMMDETIAAFIDNDEVKAFRIEPFADAADALGEELKKRHIERLCRGECSVEAGMLFNDYITAFEKLASHCRNTAAFVIQSNNSGYRIHSDAHEERRRSESYKAVYSEIRSRYSL